MSLKYASCCFLEYGGVHFTTRMVRPCCHIYDHSSNLLHALCFKMIYDAGYFNAEQYTAHINTIKAMNRSENPLCKKCGYFEERC